MQSIGPQVHVRVSNCDASSIRCHPHASSVALQFQSEELVLYVTLPERQPAATAAAGKSQPEARFMMSHAPCGTASLCFGLQLNGQLSAGDIFHDDDDFSDSGKCVGDIGDAAQRQLFSIGADRDASRTTDVCPKGRVVLMQCGSRFQIALQLTVLSIPCADNALQVTRIQRRFVRRPDQEAATEGAA